VAELLACSNVGLLWEWVSGGSVVSLVFLMGVIVVVMVERWETKSDFLVRL